MRLMKCLLPVRGAVVVAYSCMHILAIGTVDHLDSGPRMTTSAPDEVTLRTTLKAIHRYNARQTVMQRLTINP
jgi:hypothetical protein